MELSTQLDASPSQPAAEQLQQSSDCRGWRVQALTSHPSQAATAVEWNRLAGPIPFRSYEWIEAWWRHCATTEMSPLVITVRSAEGELLGLAPWLVRHCPLRGRVIQTLGGGEICSDYIGLLAGAAQQTQVAEHVARFLIDMRSDWDLLKLEGVDASDVGIQTLIDTLVAAGHTPDVRQPYNAWQLALGKTWDDVVRPLSRGRRERVRSMIRQAFDSGRYTARIVRAPEELTVAWPAFVDLHQRRRQSMGQRGRFASPSFAAFHADISRQWAERGRLRLHLLERDGRPVASDYSLTDDQTVFMYQTGFDPELADENVGTLNLISTLRTSVQEGFQTYDFLRGDEPYKASWRARCVPMWEVRVVGRRLGAEMRYHGLQRASRARREALAWWLEWRASWGMGKKSNPANPPSAAAE